MLKRELVELMLNRKQRIRLNERAYGDHSVSRLVER